MELEPKALWRPTPVAWFEDDGDPPELADAVRELQPRLAEALAAARESGPGAHVLVLAGAAGGGLDLVEALLAAGPPVDPAPELAWTAEPSGRPARLVELPSGAAAGIVAAIDELRLRFRALRRALVSEEAGPQADAAGTAESLVAWAASEGDVRRRTEEAVRLLVGRWRDESPAIQRASGALAGWLDELPDRLAAGIARVGTDGDLRDGSWLVRLGPDRSAPAEEPARPSAARAGIVREDHPTWGDVFGYLPPGPGGEGRAALDRFRPGSLHRARGGVLLVDGDRLVAARLSGLLGRVLDRGELRLEDAEGGREAGLPEPDPVPLGPTRVVIVAGSRAARYLRAADPEERLFPVVVELEGQRWRDETAERALGRFARAWAAREGLGRPDAGAVARLVEESARRQGEARRLAVDPPRLAALLREADRLAAAAPTVPRRIVAEHVERAVEVLRERVDGARRRSLEQIGAQVVRIETSGRRVGQCNGIVVLRSEGESFGRPARVTARARAGKGDVVAIEREVKLSGSVHHKGVLILTSFLAGRYTAKSLSLSASVVFEQSYGPIDGDSASLAELLALLSAVTAVPLRQDRAVTGAVDQLGRVQAVGGIHPKIEGFFDLCAARGLDGNQGVVLPADNVAQLMLRREVRDAVADGTFHLWGVATVDEAIELLTGREAGVRTADGGWPPGSFNHLVAARLVSAPERPKAQKATAKPAAVPAAPSAPPPPTPESTGPDREAPPEAADRETD